MVGNRTVIVGAGVDTDALSARGRIAYAARCLPATVTSGPLSDPQLQRPRS